jgi:hypothetical protein
VVAVHVADCSVVKLFAHGEECIAVSDLELYDLGVALKIELSVTPKPLALAITPVFTGTSTLEVTLSGVKLRIVLALAGS